MKNNMQMNTSWGRWFPLIIVVLGLWSACADPTFVGADILDEDRVNAAFTDTITMRSRTVRGDSVLTYAPSPNWLSAYLFGNFKDPLFGNTFAEIFAQPTLEISSVSYLRPDFKDALLDSVILVLPYTASGFYGNTEQEFSLEVYELTDSMARDSAYFSNRAWSYGDLIGSTTFVPSLDSVTFIDYRTTSPDTVSLAQLRVPMTDQFSRRLILADTSSYVTNADFQRFFRGLVIRPATETNGMISFNMVPSGGNYDAGIYVYYRRDTIPTQYRFPISYSSPVSGHFVNDHSGSVIEPLINSTAFSDSIAVVQGTEGLLMEIEFPNLEGLKDVIVNKAELLIPVSNLAGDDLDLYPSATQLFAYYINPVTNNYVPIDDITLAASSTIGIVFGGLLATGANGAPDVYKMNISAFFQELLKDDRESDIRDVIYLGVSPRSERISRSILYGANHPEHPIKLRLTYTTQ